MKRIQLLAATMALAISIAQVLAQDTTTEAADQTQEQKDCCKGMMGKDMGNMMGMMGMGDMMSNWKDHQAELDKLVADMNAAPSDKQRKAMHERMQKIMTEGRQEMMKMGRMMMMMRMMDRMMGGDKKARERANTHNIIKLKSLDRHPNPD